MAIVLGLYAVVVEKAAIARFFPGGLAGFEARFRDPYVADNELWANCFMSGADAEDFSDRVRQYGVPASHIAELGDAYVSSGEYPWLMARRMVAWDDSTLGRSPFATGGDNSAAWHTGAACHAAMERLKNGPWGTAGVTKVWKMVPSCLNVIGSIGQAQPQALVVLNLDAVHPAGRPLQARETWFQNEAFKVLSEKWAAREIPGEPGHSLRIADSLLAARYQEVLRYAMERNFSSVCLPVVRSVRSPLNRDVSVALAAVKALLLQTSAAMHVDFCAASAEEARELREALGSN
jgi:hypothetical protein